MGPFRLRRTSADRAQSALNHARCRRRSTLQRPAVASFSKLLEKERSRVSLFAPSSAPAIPSRNVRPSARTAAGWQPTSAHAHSSHKMRLATAREDTGVIANSAVAASEAAAAGRAGPPSAVRPRRSARTPVSAPCSAGLWETPHGRRYELSGRSLTDPSHFMGKSCENFVSEQEGDKRS